MATIADSVRVLSLGNVLDVSKGNKDGICYARDCVLDKGILSCGLCQEFPCERIRKDPKATLLSPLWLKWKASQRES